MKMKISDLTRKSKEINAFFIIDGEKFTFCKWTIEHSLDIEKEFSIDGKNAADVWNEAMIKNFDIKPVSKALYLSSDLNKKYRTVEDFHKVFKEFEASKFTELLKQFTNHILGNIPIFSHSEKKKMMGKKMILRQNLQICLQCSILLAVLVLKFS